MSLRLSLDHAYTSAGEYQRDKNITQANTVLESALDAGKNELLPKEQVELGQILARKKAFPSHATDELMSFTGRVIARLKVREQSALPNISSLSLRGEDENKMQGQGLHLPSSSASLSSISVTNAGRKSLTMSGSATAPVIEGARPTSSWLYKRIYPATSPGTLNYYDNIHVSFEECSYEDSCSNFDLLVKSGQEIAWDKILILLCGNVEPFNRKKFLETVQRNGGIPLQGIIAASGVLLHHQVPNHLTRLLADDILTLCDQPSKVVEHFESKDMQTLLSVIFEGNPDFAKSFAAAFGKAQSTYSSIPSAYSHSMISSSSSLSRAGFVRPATASASALTAKPVFRSLYSILYPLGKDDDYGKIDAALNKNNHVFVNARIEKLGEDVDWTKVLLSLSGDAVSHETIAEVLNNITALIPAESFKDAVKLTKEGPKEFAKLMDETFLSSCSSPAEVLEVFQSDEMNAALAKMDESVVRKVTALIQKYQTVASVASSSSASSAKIEISGGGRIPSQEPEVEDEGAFGEEPAGDWGEIPQED